MNKNKITNGDLVIADVNTMNNYSFNRSVILLTEHTPKKTLGFILNKSLNIKLKDIVPNTNSKFKVYYGGPVEPENLYFIHNVPELINDSIEISNGIYWGGNFNNIVDLINEDKLKAVNIRFFLGYTGWEEDQLEYEIETNSWLIKENIFKNKLLKETPSKLWKELMMTFGDDQIIWCNAPEDPVLN